MPYPIELIPVTVIAGMSGLLLRNTRLNPNVAAAPTPHIVPTKTLPWGAFKTFSPFATDIPTPINAKNAVTHVENVVFSLRMKIENIDAKIGDVARQNKINETDVSLAKASKAILIGFNVKPNREAKKLAEEQKVDIKYFNIIYEALDYVEKSLSGLLEPEIKETVLWSAEIQKVYKVSTAGKIAGSKVIAGEIKSKSKARIIRDGVVVYNGEILSIFREKNQVKEVGTGLECGISIKDFIDFKEKDVIESYLAEEVQRTI